MIRYRYLDEGWQAVEGDDYSLEEAQGQCFVGYKIIFDVTVREFRVDCDRDNNQQCTNDAYLQYFIDVPTTLSIETPPNCKVKTPPYIAKLATPKIRRLDGTTDELASWLISQTIYCQGQRADGWSPLLVFIKNRYSKTQRNHNWGFLPNTLTNLRYEPLRTEPDDCIRDCLFKVFLENEEVLSITRSTCPEVEIINNECPEDTYEFDCGTHLCCYKPDGFAHSRIELS